MVESVSLLSSIEYDPSTTHFPLQNIPFGVFHSPEGPHVCTRIGDSVIDLSVLFEHGLLVGDKNVFKSASLNEFISQGKDYWHAIRVQIQKVFTKGN